MTAKDLVPVGWDQGFGWGLINVGAALHLATRLDEDDIVILVKCVMPAEKRP